MPMTIPRVFLCPPVDGTVVESTELLGEIDYDERKLISDVLLSRAGGRDRSCGQHQMRSGDRMRFHQVE